MTLQSYVQMVPFYMTKEVSEVHLPKTKVLMEQCSDLTSSLLILFLNVNMNAKAINWVIYPGRQS